MLEGFTARMLSEFAEVLYSERDRPTPGADIVAALGLLDGAEDMIRQAAKIARDHSEFIPVNFVEDKPFSQSVELLQFREALYEELGRSIYEELGKRVHDQRVPNPH